MQYLNLEFLVGSIGHLSFGLSAVSFAMRSLMWLRIISMISLSLSLVYNLMVPQIYWLVVYWLGIFIAINAWQLIALIRANNEITLSHRLGLIRAQSFPGMSSRAFLKLYDSAQIQKIIEETIVVDLGGATTGLSLIIRGEVVEKLNSGEERKIVAGQFFGDLTLVQPSTLTVSPTLCVATPGTELAYWSYEHLEKLIRKNEQVKSGVFQAMSHALATKHTMRLAATG